MPRRSIGYAALAGLTACALVFAACGDDDDPEDVVDDAQDQVEEQLTPDDGGDATPAGEDTPAAGGDAEVTLRALDGNQFSEDELTAQAGAVTIEFINEEEGVIHNVTFFPSEDELSDPIGGTDLTPGPDTQTATLELEAGDYFYHCDSHPAEMQGTLHVE